MKVLGKSQARPPSADKWPIVNKCLPLLRLFRNQIPKFEHPYPFSSSINLKQPHLGVERIRRRFPFPHIGTRATPSEGVSRKHADLKRTRDQFGLFHREMYSEVKAASRIVASTSHLPGISNSLQDPILSAESISRTTVDDLIKER